MAEALLKKISRAHAKSAGIDPEGGGYKIDRNVVDALKEIGIDLHNAKAKKLTEAMLEEADIIITFRCREKIPERFRPKVEEWNLGRKRGAGQKQSERTLAEVRGMRDMILRKVKQLAQRLDDQQPNNESSG
jgi:protein-tyrosine-phosphatase